MSSSSFLISTVLLTLPSYSLVLNSQTQSLKPVIALSLSLSLWMIIVIIVRINLLGPQSKWGIRAMTIKLLGSDVDIIDQKLQSSNTPR